MSQASYQKNRRSLAFGTITAVIAIASVAGAILMLVLNNAYAACMSLGIASCTLGVSPVLWPGRPWYASRNRFIDFLFYGAFGVSLILLAPWVHSLPAPGTA